MVPPPLASARWEGLQNLADLPSIGAGPHSALGPLDVHIWCVDHAVETGPEQMAPLLALLSVDEHERLARMSNERGRRNFVMGRALCRRALSNYAPVQSQDWRFRLGDRGKPSIADPVLSSPLWFNLSHSNRMSICAVTGAGPEIGIDIERIAAGKDTLEIATQFFPDSEVNALHRLPPTQRDEAFVRLWALKESFVKACETSLAEGLSSTMFDLARLDSIRVTDTKSRHERSDLWRFRLFSLEEGLILALAVRTPAAGLLKLRIKKGFEI